VKKVSTATVKNLIDEFIHLSLDDKEYVVEIIKKQLIEAKREAIAKREKTAMASFRKKMTKSGTVKELYKDLESD
jgi:phosphoglycerate-specific signal transduction histidine kinase